MPRKPNWFTSTVDEHATTTSRLVPPPSEFEKGVLMSNKKKKRHPAAAPQKPQERGGGRRRKISWLAAAAITLVAVVAVSALLPDEKAEVASPIESTDVREKTKEYIGYYNSIQLTPEQELVKRQALSRIPAPCCSDNSAYTCCCPCNMAKTWWGLSHHLIADEGYGAEKVQAAVEGWIDLINPKGFSGKSCYTGGCKRPFHRDGCGGMDEKQILF